MTGRPWISPGRPPWDPPRWWHGIGHRVTAVAALMLLDPARAGRAWWAPIAGYRADRDR